MWYTESPQAILVHWCSMHRIVLVTSCASPCLHPPSLLVCCMQSHQIPWQYWQRGVTIFGKISRIEVNRTILQLLDLLNQQLLNQPDRRCNGRRRAYQRIQVDYTD